jgi:hypothetical protein
MTDKEAAGRVARIALGVLARQIVLPATVYRDAESDFSGQTGDTITIRKPAVLTARTYSSRSNPIVSDDVTESGVTVSFGDPLYSSVVLPDEAAEFEVVDFAAQVVAPQLRAVGEGAEEKLADVFNAFTTAEDIAVTISGETSDVLNRIVDAGAVLNTAKVARANRFLAVDPVFEALLLKTDLVRRVDQSGTDTALLQAIISKLFGFTIVGSNALDEGTAVAYSREAFAFVMRSQKIPQGAVMGSNMSYGGLALRWIQQYDPNYLQDQSVVSALAGVATLDATRAVKLSVTGS